MESVLLLPTHSQMHPSVLNIPLQGAREDSKRREHTLRFQVRYIHVLQKEKEREREGKDAVVGQHVLIGEEVPVQLKSRKIEFESKSPITKPASSSLYDFTRWSNIFIQICCRSVSLCQSNKFYDTHCQMEPRSDWVWIARQLAPQLVLLV